ncbi:hypothetical protein VN96_2374 [Lactococcus cremoris]|nr:hypothetical protein VN96_2374 [Lactococcus cremoris]
MIPVTLKTRRYPVILTRTPPTIGPINVPATEPVVSNDKTEPDFSLGAELAIKAIELDTNPEKAPSNILKIRSCQAAVTKAIREIEMAIPREALKSINFRPFWSANLPHRGETMAKTIKVDEKTRPDQIFNSVFE